MLFQYSDLVMRKYTVKLFALVELMLCLNVSLLFLKLPGLCFIPDVITMFRLRLHLLLALFKAIEMKGCAMK